MNRAWVWLGNSEFESGGGWARCRRRRRRLRRSLVGTAMIGGSASLAQVLCAVETQRKRGNRAGPMGVERRLVS